MRDTFALRFNIDWSYVDIIRTFVNNFLQRGLVDSKKSDKLSMAVSELLENAVKYSTIEEENRINNIHIQLDVFKEDRKIIFFVENTATPENFKILQDQLKIVNMGSPKEMYINKIKESMLSEEKSQLGLARIRYEAEGKIFLENKNENRVRIKVVFGMD